MSKPFARKFYSSKAWQDCRNAYAKKANHLCENCLRQGIYKPGVIVHHIIQLTPMNIERPEVTLNYKNLELLCRDCHKQKHELDGIGWAAYNKRRKEKKLSENRFIVDENGKVFSK